MGELKLEKRNTLELRKTLELKEEEQKKEWEKLALEQMGLKKSKEDLERLVRKGQAQSFFQSFRLALFTVQETRYAIFAGAFRMSTAVRLSWPKLVMVQRVVVAESSGSRVIYWRVLLFIEFNFFTRYLFLLSEFIQ